MNFTQFLNAYVDNLQIEGELAVGKIDGTEKFEEFKGALRKYGFTYTTRSSRKENFSFEDGPKKKLPGRGSLMFKSSSDVSVPFFGYPFVVETTTYYTCSQGLKYYGSKRFPDEMFRLGDPLAKKRRKPKSSQKIGCQARMSVKKIKVFFSEEYYIGRDNWREKKAAIDVLRKDLEQNNKVESFFRYYLLISMDSVHNHEAIPKGPVKARKSTVHPAKKVLKLQDQLTEALNHIKGGLITDCTNMTTLIQCSGHLKSIINALTDSIEKKNGLPEEMVSQLRAKVQEKQLRCCKNAEKRDKKCRVESHALKEDVVMENCEVPHEETPPDQPTQTIEMPAVIDEGGQMIWDPMNVSYVLDGQQLVLQESEETRDSKPILLQRRNNDGTNCVITQGGQNYTIVQQGGVQMAAPFTIAKVVPPSSVLPSASGKKSSKKNEVGVSGVTIAIPAGVDWTQHNWNQPIVVSSELFASALANQSVWNVMS